MKDIKKELKEFQEFKSKYVFKQKEIEEINGKQYCMVTFIRRGRKRDW